MSRKRIYEWMLHYRNVAERRRFRITRWKLTAEEALQLCYECGDTMGKPTDELYDTLAAGTARIFGIPAVIR